MLRPLHKSAQSHAALMDFCCFVFSKLVSFFCSNAKLWCPNQWFPKKKNTTTIAFTSLQQKNNRTTKKLAAQKTTGKLWLSLINVLIAYRSCNPHRWHWHCYMTCNVLQLWQLLHDNLYIKWSAPLSIEWYAFSAIRRALRKSAAQNLADELADSALLLRTPLIYGHSVSKGLEL